MPSSDRWLRKKRNLKESNKHRLDNLVDEVLLLIIEQICLSEGATGLLNLALVSRCLYLRVIPRLYRSIDLDLGLASHTRLLRRLAQSKSEVQGYIRALSVRNVTSTHLAISTLLAELEALVTRLSRVTSLIWKVGSLDVPLFVLDALEKRSPGAKLSLTADQGSLEADELLPLHSVLAHPAGSQMTFFEFRPQNQEQLYDDFKHDLLKMLSQNRVLKTFTIFLATSIHRDYSEMCYQLQESSLPKLDSLGLYTGGRLFSTRELSIWASKGGFGHLKYLGLNRLPQLASFLGHTPELERLVCVPSIEDDIVVLEDVLARMSIKSPFGSVSCFGYTPPRLVGGLGISNPIMPWSLLKLVPDLKTLQIVHFIQDRDRGENLEVLMPADIARIRSLSSKLETLAIDISLEGPYAKWPYDVLTELARFPQMLTLKLFVHRQRCLRANFKTIPPLHFKPIGVYIRNERQRLNLSWQSPFRVEFKDVEPWERMQHHWNLPNYKIEFFKSVPRTYARTEWHQYETPIDRLDQMSIEKLEEKKAKQLTGKIGWDRKGYGREIHRRQKTESAESGFMIDTTL